MSNYKPVQKIPCQFCKDGKLFTPNNLAMHQATKHREKLAVGTAALSDVTAKLQVSEEMRKALEAELITAKSTAPAATLRDWDASEWLEKMSEEAWQRIGEVNGWTQPAPVADAETDEQPATEEKDAPENHLEHVYSCPGCKAALFKQLEIDGYSITPPQTRVEPVEKPKPVITAKMPNGRTVRVTGVRV